MGTIGKILLCLLAPIQLIVNISNITIVQTKKEELINASYMLSNFQNIFCHFFDYFVNHAQTFIFAWAN